ncbi:unnamed protein product [Paramecium octaurelia]|uniref:Uncharacterized protein n=1 Tax=Paramecium octaurelia TaxID=43137 RepID=A0A8S1U5Y3_PAROT|nr:unnamed protein product [Paramecium octaurelia]
MLLNFHNYKVKALTEKEKGADVVTLFFMYGTLFEWEITKNQAIKMKQRIVKFFNSNLMKEICLRLYEYLKNDVICQLNKMRNEQIRVQGKYRQQLDEFIQK